MKLAIMQPYLFPYIGYFQLIHSVDKFIIYDDVAFIQKGWINRNRILNQGKAIYFTVPLQKVSQNKLICETRVAEVSYEEKLFRTLQRSYGKAPYYKEIIPLIKKVFSESCLSISELSFNSIRLISNVLDLSAEFILSSKTYDNAHLKGKDRIIDICQQEGATHYINASGGRLMYSFEDFLQKGIQLSFIETLPYSYPQPIKTFIKDLSIIDMLMFCGVEGTKELLVRYQLCNEG